MCIDRGSPVASALALTGVLLAGCAGSSKPTPTGRPLSLGDFVDESRADLAVVDDAATPPSPVQDGDRDIPAPVPLPEPPPENPVPAPATGADDPEQAGRTQMVIVDSLVGQVNGRPIYASDFFDPIEDRLVALSARTTQLMFRNEAARIIYEALQQRVVNELVLAEAQAGISVEQQQGLLNFFRQRQISQGGGTEIGAERRLQQQEGVGMEDFVSDQMDQALVVELLRERVERNVIVTWRDIEREYRRKSAQFNPPPEVVLSRIRVNTRTEADKIDEVKQRLAAGDDFAEVGAFVASDEGREWRRFTLDEEGIDGVVGERFEGQLEPVVGSMTEGVEVGSSIWWLAVTEINQPQGRPLFDPDVQRQLAMEIRGRRRAEEQNRFIGELLEGGIMDELNTMADRLLAIAILRYAP